MLTCYNGEPGRVIAYVNKTLLHKWVGICSFCLGRHYKHYTNSRGQEAKISLYCTF